MPPINKRKITTTALCALGAAVLFFPGSIFLLAIGAALGYWGCTKITRSNDS